MPTAKKTKQTKKKNTTAKINKVKKNYTYFISFGYEMPDNVPHFGDGFIQRDAPIETEEDIMAIKNYLGKELQTSQPPILLTWKLIK